MKIHRFIINKNIREGVLEIEDKDLVKQIKSVLRLKEGDKVLISDGNMNEALTKIIKIKGDVLEVEVEKIESNKNEPSANVSLFCAVLKRENFELVVQKATEVGVKEIFPIITSRTVKTGFKKDRLEKIIKEASEQSGRGIVPKLHEPIKFEEAFVKAKGMTNLFFDLYGKKIENKKYNREVIGIWIGPEGGWEKEELELAKENGFEIVSLGGLTLRAETAAIVASYLFSV